ncbi:MAG: flagellar hook-associated protein FlgL [Myxococcota bacterium]
MRVTNQQRWAFVRNALTTSQNRFDELSNRAVTGLEIESPSDGAASWASVVRRSDRIQRLESRQATVERAQEDLAITEGTLAEANNLMIRVRELAVSLVDDTYSADDRAAAAIEVEELREQMITLANTEGGRGYLFGGTALESPPFDATATYLGNDAEMYVAIGEGQRMPINITGSQAFADPGGRDIFADLENLVTALRTDDRAGINDGIDAVTEGQDQLIRARGEAGIRLGRLRSVATVTETAVTLALEQQSEEQEVDLTEAIIDLTNAQQSYQRAISVSQQIIQLTSLIEPF